MGKTGNRRGRRGPGKASAGDPNAPGRTDRPDRVPRPLAEAIMRMEGADPPTTAAEALAETPAIATLLSKINGDRLADLLSGLLTLPELQANADRLEWAVRLALGVGGGGRAPRRRDLDALLNSALVEARVDCRDDPVEDLFVAPVLTPWGEFRTFPGRWEGAIPATEDLLAGFLGLPDWPGKQVAVFETLCLLRLGDAVAERASLSRHAVGSGDPWTAIPLPSDERLKRIAARTRFSSADLEALGIPVEALRPFVLDDDERPETLTHWAGDTPLELRPLRERRGGYALTLPSGVTTAVRGRLVSAASGAGLLDELHWRLFVAQSRRIDDSRYASLPPPRRRKDGLMIREAMVVLSATRLMHFLHTTAGFEGWPIAKFGSRVAMDRAWHAAVSESVERACVWAEERHPGTEVVTMMILGGWGGAREYEFAPRARWRFVSVTPETLEVLEMGDDGDPEDVFRLQDQLDRLRAMGFEITDSNGLANMVAWWQRTEHTLVPGGDPIVAPFTVMVPIDLVLSARVEAAYRLDARSLPRPHGPRLRAIRAEPHPAAGEPRDVYVATAPLASRFLLGAAVAADECWWIDLVSDASNATARETWKAALQWLGICMTAALGPTEGAPVDAVAMRLAVEAPDEAVFDQLRADPWDLTVSECESRDGPLLTVGAGWQQATARAHNDAEVALAATLLSTAAGLRGDPLTIEQAHAIALAAAGSRDMRFRHALHAEGALGLMAGHGLVPDHRRIPTSAGALLKCGSAFLVREQDLPSRIEGKGPCLDFLQAYVAEQWRLLLDAVAKFDRAPLVVAALSRFQAAANEQRRWKSTAAALRAVHGAEADRDASHDVMVRANGTMRACSLLSEIAASQAAASNGLEPGVMDVDDLLARTLMLFLVEDTAASIRLDRARPLLGIGPTGEVLFEHEFESLTLRHSSAVRHRESRDDDVSAYSRNFEEPRDRPETDPKLAAALEAEYGADFLAFVDMSFAPAQLAINAGSSVVVGRMSAIVGALEALEPFAGKRLDELVSNLTLPSRHGWLDRPAGMSAADFDIARFDRRLSLSARPLVALDDGDDPLVALAPGVVQRAIMIALGGAMSGSLQNAFWRSAEMRRYAGVRGGEAGMAFNHEVADAARSLGMRAEVDWGVARSTGAVGTPELTRLGDLDVLAVSPDRRRVWVLEAKELKLCRTLGEAARRLSEYRGVVGADGKPDKLLRHLRRVAHLRDNAAGLMRSLDLPAIPAVSGAVVVGAPQPMQMAPASADPDGTVIRLAELADAPWDTGWQKT